MGKPINVSGGTLTAKDHAVINDVMTDSNGIAETFGNKMGHRLDSVNEIAILDGFAMVQGRAYVIYPGDEEKKIIKSGNQGMKRHDLIVLEFDNSLEKLEIKVLEGAEDSSNPSDPELTQEDTLGGGNLYQMPLYRVVVDSLNVSVEDMREYLTVGGGFAYLPDSSIPTVPPIELIDLVYPIGSVYLSADSVNPSFKFLGTSWELIGEKLAVRENVFGNGKSLSLTNGSGLWAFGTHTSSSTTYSVGKFVNAYGKDISANDPGTLNNTQGILGVPTKEQLEENPEYSGLIVDAETIYSWKRIS